MSLTPIKETLKCPLCGLPLDLSNDLFTKDHLGYCCYEDRTVYYYECIDCPLASEYADTEDEAWEKAKQLVDKCLEKFNQKEDSNGNA
jgi:hypothetical protein|nr:MAG TPA: zinc-ribbon domain protein [Caudoviricetes sp.]